MPVSSAQNPISAQSISPSQSHYRSEISPKGFSTFLNRPLIVASREPALAARFTLVDLLNTLNCNSAILKGSTVNCWKSNKAIKDIDLQLPDSQELEASQLIEQVKNFLCIRAGNNSVSPNTIDQKTWFTKVSHDMKNGWNRLILHIGYPRANTSTLDLNFTNSPKPAHDTIHASRTIQFQLSPARASVVDAWHPELVNWLSSQNLLCFNPNIEDGLMRLSYRISKSPGSYMLQSKLPKVFCANASNNHLKGIYLRVLSNQYANSELSHAERRTLWEPLIDSAEKIENIHLKRDLLAWSKFEQLGQLKDAIRHPENLPALIDRLGQGCQIGADFRNTVKATLNKDATIHARLQPVITKAMGAKLIPGEILFQKLDTWQRIQDVPKHELQKVFGERLNELEKHGTPEINQRAQHMLGWLQGRDSSSLNFWIDRIPQHQRNAPTESQMRPVMHHAIQLLQAEGVEGLAASAKLIGQLRVRESDWHTLSSELLNAKPSANEQTNSGAEPTLQFMRLIANNAPLLKAFIPGAKVDLENNSAPMPTQQFYQQMMAFIETTHGNKLPPALRSVVRVNRGEFEIKLPDLLLQVSMPQGTIAAVVGQFKHWVSENTYAVLQPVPAGTGQTLQVMWRDGTMFSGKQPNNVNFSFEGKMSRICKPDAPSGLNELLHAGRQMAKNLLLDVDLQKGHWTASGIFNGQQLLKAKDIDQAMLAMKQGVIHDLVRGSRYAIQHHIQDHQAERCTVSLPSTGSKLELHAPYRQEQQYGNQTSISSALTNPWKASLDLDNTQSICRLDFLPFGEVKLTRMTGGEGEVHGTGAMNFKWQGRLESGELKPEGKLFLEKQKTASIEFNSNTPSASIPLTLLPVMADLLSRNRNTDYTLKPSVWGDSNQWPAPGFEGFVNLQRCGGNLFSGYITSKGNAFGVVNEIANAGSSSRTFKGTFLIRDLATSKLPFPTLDGHTKAQMRMPLNEKSELVPHGLIQEYIKPRLVPMAVQQSEKIYFCGQAIDYQRMLQGADSPYDAPNQTRYFAGINYTQNGQARQIDLVFNPEDGGQDFLIIRPKSYEKQSNYQENYRDSQGVHANWLVAGGRYQMGQIQLPCGIEYSGRVQLQGNQFELTGRGKFTLGALSFTGEFGHDSTVSQLEGLNAESRHWLQAYGGDKPGKTFQLDEWLEIISGGRLNWQKDVQQHLRCRDLRSLKANAIVFSGR